jgi:hypothetical protein
MERSEWQGVHGRACMDGRWQRCVGKGVRLACTILRRWASKAERQLTVRPLTRCSSVASSIGTPTAAMYSAPAWVDSWVGSWVVSWVVSSPRD